MKTDPSVNTIGNLDGSNRKVDSLRVTDYQGETPLDQQEKLKCTCDLGKKEGRPASDKPLTMSQLNSNMGGLVGSQKELQISQNDSPGDSPSKLQYMTFEKRQ